MINISNNPTKYHVIRINTRIYPDKEGGGPAKHGFYLSKYTSGKKIRFTNIACAPKGFRPSQYQVNNSFTIDLLPFYAPDLHGQRIFNYVQFIVKFLICTWYKVLKIVRKQKVHLIHVHTPPITGIIALFFKWFFGIPYVYTYHGVDFASHLEQILDWKLIHRFANEIFIISNKIRKYFLRQGGSNKNITQVDNGIELIKYRTSNKPKLVDASFLTKYSLTNLRLNDRIITYIGLMVFQQKVQGMIDFMQAFDQFLENNPVHIKELKLVFIGDGPFKSMLTNALNGIKHKSNVVFAGFQKNVPEFLEIAQLNALTSYVEGFPNVILEAMAFSVPSIATKVGEIKKLVTGNGFVVKSGDIKAIEDSLLNFFSDKSLQLQLSAQSYSTVKSTYDWAIIGKKMEQKYIEIIESANKRV